MFKDTDNGKTCFNRCGECKHGKKVPQDVGWLCGAKGNMFLAKHQDTSECKEFKLLKGESQGG